MYRATCIHRVGRTARWEGGRGAFAEFFIDNLMVRIHIIIEMILVDRPCAMGI